jgi:16S rRNA (adenine1518-N6/adenine1519-N6)-dimethyltransferase
MSTLEFLTLHKSLALLQAKGVNIKKHLGQHLLIDKNGRDKILSFASLSEDDVVVEIGPGLGGMTDGYIDKVKSVYGFEIDPEFCSILRERFTDYENFYLAEKDFLEVSDEWWNQLPCKVKVIGNTPYYMSSPIAFRLLRLHKKIKLALLTVQKEVGERFTAGPGSKNYGAISVLMSIYTDSKICYSLKKEVFFPKPEVSSVLVRIFPLEKPRVDIIYEKRFWEFLPLIFSFRRKKLPNVVNKIFNIEKGFFKRAVEREGISADARVEDLSPEDIYKIFKIVTPQKEKNYGDVDRH